MAERPDHIVLGRHRDLEGRRNQVWARRGILGLLGVVSLLAALNVFGQHPTTSTTSASAAELEVRGPDTVRPGLLYEVRFTIRATETLDEAVLLFEPGWLDGMTLNTVEPAPVSETSENGFLRMGLGPIDGGDEFQLVFQFQVNPTSVGRRSQNVTLLDGDEEIATIDRTLTVFP
jgi:hypothetical protein